MSELHTHYGLGSTVNRKATKGLELLPAEGRVPTDAELLAYGGLQEIRFRRDTVLEVGLFLRPEDQATVVGFASANHITVPYTFEVPREAANAAFEEPWSYAPATGKIILEGILEKPVSIAA